MAAPDGEVLAETRLRGLMAMSAVLERPRRFHEVVRMSAEAALTALGAASVSLSRIERERGLLRTLVNVGTLGPDEVPEPQDEVYAFAEYPMLATLLLPDHPGFVVDLRQTVPPSHAQALRRRRKASALAVPLVIDGRTWGELYATRAGDETPFSTADLAFSRAVAAQTAAGLAQAMHLERAQRLAYADPLTGLGNRRAFDAHLDAAMERHRVEGAVVTVVLGDVNGLKTVNDTDGHDAGDELILAVADLVSAAAAALPGGFAARMGGDEFCLAYVDVSADDVIVEAAKLCTAVRGLPTGGGLACGVASTADPVGVVDTPKRLLRLADAAQYRAKRSGALRPVVAGRRLPEGTARALPAVPEIEPGVPERRRAFPRSTAEPSGVLNAGVNALDQSRADDVRSRLEVVADLVARRLDAAAWRVSLVEKGSPILRSVSYSLYRDTGEGGGSHEARFVLVDYPWKAAAVQGGGYSIEAGAPHNDPAEDAALVAGGHTGAVVAGATTPAGGWLVEVLIDEVSARVAGLAPVMRALVAVAAHG